MSIREGEDGRALVHCHAGCTVEEIVRGVGLTLADLFPGSGRRRSQAPEDRLAAARKRREIAAEEALRQAMRRAEAGLAALYRDTNDALAAGGWEKIMAGDPGADELAAFAHALPYWEYLLDRCLAGDFSAFEAAAREVAAHENC